MPFAHEVVFTWPPDRLMSPPVELMVVPDAVLMPPPRVVPPSESDHSVIAPALVARLPFARMSVAALMTRGLPEAQEDRLIAALSVTELFGEPTVRFPQVVPAVVSAELKVSAPPESIEVLVPASSLIFKSATFRLPALPAEIAL